MPHHVSSPSVRLPVDTVARRRGLVEEDFEGGRESRGSTSSSLLVFDCKDIEAKVEERGVLSSVLSFSEGEEEEGAEEEDGFTVLKPVGALEGWGGGGECSDLDRNPEDIRRRAFFIFLR